MLSKTDLEIDLGIILYSKTDKEQEFTVTKDSNGPTKRGTTALPIDSPLGEAIEGCEEGDISSFLIENKQQTIQIVSVVKSS